MNAFREPRLSFVDVVASVAAMLALGAAAAGVLWASAAGNAAVERFMRLDPTTVMALFALFYAVGGLGVAAGVARHGRDAARLIGLTAFRWRWAVAASAATVGLSILITSVVLPALGEAAGADMTPSATAVLGRLVDTPRRLVVALVVVAVLAPLVEELIFRGLLFGWLQGAVGGGTALLVTTVLFGVAHSNPASPEVATILGTGALGLVLGYARLRTGSIWPSVVAHAVNNGVAVLGVYLAR